jgi:hypothetical protein
VEKCRVRGRKKWVKHIQGMLRELWGIGKGFLLPGLIGITLVGLGKIKKVKQKI